MSPDIFNLPVFPAADVFPMMAHDELAELAADIAENGLRQALVIAEAPNEDGEPVEMLIDGRNRREACKLAGVEPTIIKLNGEDPLSYVESSDMRRDVTQGQRAMAYALRRPKPKKTGRGNKVPEIGHFGTSTQRIAEARAVLAFSPELANEVVAGAPLGSALEKVRAAQGQSRNERARMEKLRVERPDLAAAVDSEAMSLEDALAKASAEAEERKQQRWAATMEVIDGLRPFDRAAETAADNIAFYDAALAESRGETVSPGRLRRAGAYLNALADAMEELQ